MSYYGPQGNEITVNEWLELRHTVAASQTVIVKNNYDIKISKMYFGIKGSIFKVFIECSSDLIDYYGYIKHYDGDVEATQDYNRLIQDISQDRSIYEKVSTNGDIQLIFDARWNQYIVMDMRAIPEVDFCFASTEAEAAENKFNELVNG